jgi:hypothetical protein
VLRNVQEEQQEIQALHPHRSRKAGGSEEVEAATSSVMRTSVRIRFSRASRLTAIAVLAVAVGVVAGGCGEQVDQGQAASLAVTQDFGQKVVLPAKSTQITPGLTAMRQLQKSAKVATSYGGRFVSAIDGLAGSAGAGNDWLFYVDGTQSDSGAAAWRVKAGQRIQWDFHQWRDITAPEAIVGAFPRPLSSEGVKLVCKPASSAACDLVRKQFPRDSAARDAATVVVGGWDDIAKLKGVPDLSLPAIDNGAFASFTGKPGARTIEVLGANGEIQRNIVPVVGLIAASKNGNELTWLITGIDANGAAAAAKHLLTRELRNKFALAVMGDAESDPLPIQQAGTAK